MILFLVIFLCILILALMKAGKVSIYSPAGLFAIIWLLFCFSSVALLRAEYKFSFKGVLWIMIAIIVYLIPQIIIRPNKVSHNDDIPLEILTIPWKLVTAFLIASWCAVAVTMLKNGIHAEVLFDFSKLMESTHEQAVDHYSGGSGGSILEQILGAFVYIAPLCCGYALPYASTNRQRIVCFSSFLPAILCMLLLSTKLALVTGIILFFLGYYVSYTSKNQREVRIHARYWLILGAVALGFIGLIYLSFVLRIGENDDSVHRVIINKIGVYAVGHIQGFDTWFAKADHNTLGLGAYTFRAISSRLGLLSKEQGVYSILTDSCTNVYTPFRDLIEDWGPYASLVWLFWAGIICASSYRTIMESGAKSRVSQFVLITCMFTFLYFVSPWIYTTYFFVFLVFGLFLKSCEIKSNFLKRG